MPHSKDIRDTLQDLWPWLAGVESKPPDPYCDEIGKAYRDMLSHPNADHRFTLFQYAMAVPVDEWTEEFHWLAWQIPGFSLIFLHIWRMRAAQQEPEWYNIDPLQRDLFIVEDKPVGLSKIAAAERIVARVPWKLFSKRALDSLTREASEHGLSLQAFKRQELLMALPEVSERLKFQARYWRSKRKWITDERGRKKEIIPATLPLPEYAHWVIDSMIRVAEESLGLRGDADILNIHLRPRGNKHKPPSQSDDDADSLASPEEDPLATLLRQETSQQTEILVAQWLGSLSPLELEVVVTLEKHGRTRGAMKKVAEELERQPSTIRSVATRARKKLKKILSSL